ncbi:DUF4259 domain-containing protein [Miltoncostaea oceani]|uniref:DUF4259 domain-containing protein n=1 Tax=Miltoncostaea oceani TaxID=2843216 RepID=UPI001C3DA9E7|nr:DUF4259 domain-containing protein [Miltoncostaea oceani]
MRPEIDKGAGMGAWGMRAFDNDAVLDAVPELSDRAGVIASLMAVHDPAQDTHVADVAFGAVEVIAAARMGVEGYQSESTTLFAHAGGGEDEPIPYLPDELAAFISSGRAVFSDDEVRQALLALAAIERTDAERQWDEPAARREAIAQTRARLMHALIG